MEDQDKSQGNTYDQARQAFNDLDMNDRVAFLVKESVNTIARALEMAAETIEHDCATIFGAGKSKADNADTASESQDA